CADIGDPGSFRPDRCSAVDATRFPYTTLFRSCEVSGGLDSSAVFAVAVQLQREGRLQAPDLVGLSVDCSEDPAANEIGHVRDLRSEEHTSELQSRENLVCRLPLDEKKNHRIKR